MKSSLWLPAIVLGAGIIAYANSLAGPFLYDDHRAVVNNPQIHQLWPLSIPLSPQAESPVAGRPLVNLSFAINYALGGLDVTGYHLWNIAMHLARAAARAASSGERCCSRAQGALRIGRHAHRAGVRTDLGAASASDGSGGLRDAAQRVHDGAVLSADALCKHPAMELDRHPGVRGRHGVQGIDGHRAGGRRAVRRDFRLRLVQGRDQPPLGVLPRPGE